MSQDIIDKIKQDIGDSDKQFNTAEGKQGLNLGCQHWASKCQLWFEKNDRSSGASAYVI